MVTELTRPVVKSEPPGMSSSRNGSAGRTSVESLWLQPLGGGTISDDTAIFCDLTEIEGDLFHTRAVAADYGPATGAGPGDLGTLVKRGLKWAFAGAFVMRFGTFLTGLVMARILSPRDFGVYAVAFVALTVTASVNDIGIEPTLVRWPHDLDDVAPTAITVVMAFSIALFAAFWFAAPAFARAFNTPDGTGVIRLMSVGLIISGAFTVNSAMSNRASRARPDLG